MDWIARLSAAVDHVEARLDGEISAKEAGEAASMSAYHFQRTFSVIAGVPFAEYVRRRRLTLAAREISDGKGILDTALKYGWESQVAFTRSFKALHGITPGFARDSGAVLKAYPPLSFQLTIQGARAMDYEIRKLSGFTVAGEQRSFTSENGMNYREIPKFWKEIMSGGVFGDMMKSANPAGILGGRSIGACFDFSDDQTSFNYLIGMEPREDADTLGLTVRTIPPTTWAVFKGSDPLPEGIQTLEQRIYAEWFAATEYEQAEGPEFEVYGAPSEEGGDPPYEVWIPVTKGQTR